MANEKPPKPVELRSLLCAVPVNRFSSCSVLFKINDSVLVAFGAAQQIAIWECQDQDQYPPLELLQGHQAVVSVIKKLDHEDHALGFVSGDMDGRVLVWRCEGRGTCQKSVGQWKIVARLTGHQRSISCLSSIRLPLDRPPHASGSLDEYLVVAGASDGRLIYWKLTISPTSGVLEAVEVLSRLELGNQIALDAALAFLPNSTDLLLALATTDAKVAIYSSSVASLSFALGFRLPGHTDWIRSLDFIRDPAQPKELLLASGSQDNFIRIWRCQEYVPMNVVENAQPNLDTVASAETEDVFRTLDELTQNLKEEGHLIESSDVLNLGSGTQTVEMKRYPVKNSNWTFASEALLYGHEGWVTNVHWCITPSGILQLLSTSSDRSMIMWRPSENFDGVWANVERFGELGASTNLGFFGAHYFVGPLNLSETVLASGWTGAWHRWSRQDGSPWAPRIAPTGHYRAVTALEWEREAEYLISCSSDQTTRLWGCWRRPVEEQNSVSFESWHEICRPQVHGHDLYGVSFIGDRRTKFASISEEKVIRAFDMTEDFVNVAKRLCLVNLPFQVGSRQRAQRATIPPLGLSNRVKDTEDNGHRESDLEAQQLCPPFEDQLLNQTLWPEIDKIYGHPSELSAIATSYSGLIIASACHANSAQTASIRLHSTEDGFPAIPASPLEAHQLTITRLTFNADDSKLVSVSRDRSWTVWHQPSRDGHFHLEQRMEKAHARVIWDACWAPAHMNMFVSGSRDKSAKVWSQEGEKGTWSLAETIKFDQPVKSCAVCSYPLPSQKMLLAIGLEDGLIALYTSAKAHGWERVVALELASLCHAGPVNRLCFAPKPVQPEQETQRGKVRLASGGEDGAVKVTELDMYSHCCS